MFLWTLWRFWNAYYSNFNSCLYNGTICLVCFKTVSFTSVYFSMEVGECLISYAACNLWQIFDNWQICGKGDLNHINSKFRSLFVNATMDQVILRRNQEVCGFQLVLIQDFFSSLLKTMIMLIFLYFIVLLFNSDYSQSEQNYIPPIGSHWSKPHCQVQQIEFSHVTYSLISLKC